MARRVETRAIWTVSEVQIEFCLESTNQGERIEQRTGKGCLNNRGLALSFNGRDRSDGGGQKKKEGDAKEIEAAMPGRYCLFIGLGSNIFQDQASFFA